MVQKALGHLTDLLQGRWSMDLQAFLVVTAMLSFDTCVLVWALWRTDSGLDPQTEQEAPQGGGEIATAGTADPSGITIKGEHGRQAIAAQEGHDSRKTRFPHENQHGAEQRAEERCQHRQN
jgi:hypothetical protein